MTDRQQELTALDLESLWHPLIRKSLAILAFLLQDGQAPVSITNTET